MASMYCLSKVRISTIVTVSLTISLKYSNPKMQLKGRQLTKTKANADLCANQRPHGELQEMNSECVVNSL